MMGSGEWTGNSILDHPDFAWYPFVSVADNPEVDVEVVSAILGSEVHEEQIQPSRVPGARIEPSAGGSATSSGSGSEEGNRPIMRPTITAPLDSVLTSYELVAAIVNKTSHFDLDLVVDQGDGGRYRVGEPIRVSVRSGEAGYLYLFDADTQGNLKLIFPEGGRAECHQGECPRPAGALGVKPLLVARGPGQHNLKGIVTTQPLWISGAPPVHDWPATADAVRRTGTHRPAPDRRTAGETTDREFLRRRPGGASTGTTEARPFRPGRVPLFRARIASPGRRPLTRRPVPDPLIMYSASASWLRPPSTDGLTE